MALAKHTSHFCQPIGAPLLRLNCEGQKIKHSLNHPATFSPRQNLGGLSKERSLRQRPSRRNPLYLPSGRAIRGSSFEKGARMDTAVNATRGEESSSTVGSLEDSIQKSGWQKMKKLTPEEHWLLSDAHKKNWHGLWIRYVVAPSGSGSTAYNIQEAKYGIRNIEWAKPDKTETRHQNYYFDEDFQPKPGAGPWHSSVANSTPEGVLHAASAAATTLYLPDGAAAWASKAVVPDGKPFSVAAELIVKPDQNTRVSMVAFYLGDTFGGVTLIREEARASADTLELRPKGGGSFWTYEKELPKSRSDVAAELIGTENLLTCPGLGLFEREGRFGGYGGARRAAASHADGGVIGPCIDEEGYEVVRLPDNISLRCPQKIVKGLGFELAAAVVTEDGLGASQCKGIYGSDWKLKGLMHGVYFA